MSSVFLFWLSIAAAGPATAPVQPVEIALDIPKRFPLGKHGYAASANVTIVNRSEATVTFFHEEGNSLVFEEVKGGKLHVICHPCACMLNTPKGEGAKRFAVVLAPGARKQIRLDDDWGCDGDQWRGPPPGEYLVSYRVQPTPAPHPEDPRTCCDHLRSPEYWQDAWASPGVPVTVYLRK